MRIDSALYAGYRIPPYYDSLIGKLIVHGKTRNECLMRLRRALDEFVIDGIETTIPLFQRLLAGTRHHRRRLRYPLAGEVSRPNDLAPMTTITPQMLLTAYAAGIFPMAESAEDRRTLLGRAGRARRPAARPAACRRSLRKIIRRGTYEIRIDSDFDAVIDGCATKALGRRTPGSMAASARSTAAAPARLLPHGRDLAERRAGRRALRRAARRRLLRRSMFSRRPDASKVALVHLVARLNAGGFRCSIPSSPPRICAISAPSTCRGRTITGCSRRRSRSRRISMPSPAITIERGSSSWQSPD